MEILKDFAEGEFKFPSGSVKVTRRSIEKERVNYSKKVELKNNQSIELSAEEMSSKIKELFGVEFEDGIPIGKGGGGAPPKSKSHDPYVFKSHLFNVVVSESGLEKEYDSFGFKETIITLYTSYLSNYKKDKWITNDEDFYDFSKREKSLEEQSFDIITKYYLEAMSNDDEWDFKTIKEFQKLIRVVLVSYQITELSRE